MQIICAEDDPLEGNALLHILSLEGHAVELARDGRTAYERISGRPERFDLLITDHVMPHMGGLVLAQEARAAGFKGRIIVHASNLHTELRQAYETCQVSAFVEKVNGINMLLGTIRALGRRG